MDDWVKVGLIKNPNVTIETIVKYNSVKTGDSSSYDNILCSFESGGCELGNYTTGQYNSFVAYISGYKAVSSTVKTVTNKIYSLSGSYGGSVLNLFENGTKYTKVQAGTLTYNSSVNFIIGANPNTTGGADSTGGTFKGTIYSIRMYNRVLTDAEALYNYHIDKERFNL